MRKIVAIIRTSRLEAVEARLQELGVKGISVSRVKGYGEYANFAASDWLVANAKIEIFTEQSAVAAIAAAILDSAHSGASGDGIVAVLPVEKLYRIRTRAEAEPHEI